MKLNRRIVLGWLAGLVPSTVMAAVPGCETPKPKDTKPPKGVLQAAASPAWNPREVVTIQIRGHGLTLGDLVSLEDHNGSRIGTVLAIEANGYVKLAIDPFVKIA